MTVADSDAPTIPTKVFWMGLAVVLVGWWTDTPMTIGVGAVIAVVAVLFEIFGPDISEGEEMALDADDLADDEQ
jgi:hypothetical protein